MSYPPIIDELLRDKNLDEPKSLTKVEATKAPIIDWRSQLVQPLVSVALSAAFSALEELLLRRKRKEVSLAQQARDNERELERL